MSDAVVDDRRDSQVGGDVARLQDRDVAVLFRAGEDGIGGKSVSLFENNLGSIQKYSISGFQSCWTTV